MTPQFSMFKRYHDFMSTQGRIQWFETDGNTLSECISRVVVGAVDFTGQTIELTVDALSSDEYKKIEADITRIYRLQRLQDEVEQKWRTEH